MKTENVRIVTMNDRDVRLAEANSGLEVDLAPETTKVIIRVVREEERERVVQ